MRGDTVEQASVCHLTASEVHQRGRRTHLQAQIQPIRTSEAQVQRDLAAPPQAQAQGGTCRHVKEQGPERLVDEHVRGLADYTIGPAEAFLEEEEE